MLKFLLVSACWMVYCSFGDCGPVSKDEDEGAMDAIIKENEKAGQHLYEGDINIINPPKNEVTPSQGTRPEKRNAVRGRYKLWKTKVVPYEMAIDDPYGTYQTVIDEAIAEFHKHTCLKIVPHTNQKKWIKFVKKSGCYSSVGQLFWRDGPQDLSLGGLGCAHKGIVMHELLHAIGFWHEQSRYDRDKYVEIFWENIEKANAHNFDKQKESEMELHKPYDFGSIMHYGNKAFSTNDKVTIRGWGANKNLKLGQRDAFSKTDIFEINALYDCSGPSNGWSAWSDYGPCDYKCEKRRERFCASSDRANCPGVNDYLGTGEEKVKCSLAECNAPVPGHWGKWSDWDGCSVTCGNGIHSRTRVCDDPKPKNNGKKCAGSDKQTGVCKNRPCGLDPHHCEFEFDMCSWSQANPQNDYEIKRISGVTPSGSTGPPGDFTKGLNGKGYYIYAESSSPAKTNDVAKLQSKGFLAIPGGRCITFAYSMYGNGIGGLELLVVNEKTNVQSSIFSKSGNQGIGWHYGNATITSQNNYKIVFKFTRGNSFQGDIALDDIIFVKGPCIKVPTSPPITTTPPTPPPTTSALPTTAPSGDDFKSVGCYKDRGNHPFPYPPLVNLRDGKLDWKDLKTSVVDRCAKAAKKKGYKYFGIQFYGECYSGPDAVVKYDIDGPSNACWNGVGRGGALMVYQFFK